MRHLVFVATAVMIALCLMTTAKAATADEARGQAIALKTIDNPNGGHVSYGPIANVSSMRDAMAAMLRYVHRQFGDRPQIGKFFHSKGSDSIATFFTLTAKNMGNKPTAGMVIVSIAPGSKSASAAVLYDDQARFRKTQPALMHRLNEQWGKEDRAHSSAANGRSGPYTRGTQAGGIFGSNDQEPPSEKLHLAKSPDDSASIGLPEGWHITGGSGGSLAAEGGHGESIAMGVINQNIYDPNTQQGSNMINYMRKGNTPFSACPFSSDLAADYQCVSRQQRQRHNQPPVSMRVISSRTQPGNPNQAAILAEMDFHDGKGLITASIHATAQRIGQGNWILMINEVNMPKDIADQEWPTAAGMIMSYRQNAAVIQRQTEQVIAQINARAEANRKLADAKSQANDAHNRQVDQQWDDQARQNKAFENYTLDYAVLHDPETGGSYGRADYPTAEFLVKADPAHFEYAQTQDLLKGIDY